MATLSAQQVSTNSKTDGSPAVHDFSLEVADREFLTLLGPAGCGHITALRVIAGLDAASSGEILIAGKSVTGTAPGDRDLALVLPDPALLPHLTVAGNIAFGLTKFPKSELKKRISDSAALLGVEALLDRKPATLSLLQRQRVSIARAVIRQPKAFLLQDSLARLTTADATQLRADLIRLHQHLQATIICATSDQPSAIAMSDRVAIMHDGRIEQIGDPVRVYQQPETLFVAAYLGTPPMNLIHGKIRESSGELSFKEGGDGVIDLKLPPDLDGAAALAGRDVILGVRPEGITLTPGVQRAPGRFQSLVEIVEHTGPHAHVHLQTGGHAIIARTSIPISSQDAGHRITFQIDPAAIQLFDPATSRRIGA